MSADEYLARLVEQGARERWGRAGHGAPHARRTTQQIAHELALIAKLGLAGYFLIVWDIVRFARREGILCQGRGSAANSAVCYCLGITAVDPIRLGLLFERFLSEERTEAPDIDIDFAHRERERVLQYVYERYGREHAAMVCEQITYRGKSAVRDAARVLGFSVEQADTLATLSDRFSARPPPRRCARSRPTPRRAMPRWPTRWQRDGARHRGDHAVARREGEGEAGGEADDVGRPADAERGVRAVRQPERAELRRAQDLAEIPTCDARRARSAAIGGRIRTPATSTTSVATRRPRCAHRAARASSSAPGSTRTTSACARSPRSWKGCTSCRATAPSTSAGSCSPRSRCASVVPIEPASMR